MRVKESMIEAGAIAVRLNIWRRPTFPRGATRLGDGAWRNRIAIAAPKPKTAATRKDVSRLTCFESQIPALGPMASANPVTVP